MRARTEWVALAAMALAACEGAPGPIGPAGLSVADGGTATACTAGNAFCDGTKLHLCMHSGVNAAILGDCNSLYWYGGSANNPGACSTTNCGPYDHGACCTSQKPTCIWSMTSPSSSSGTSYRYTPVSPSCYVSTAPVCAGTGTLYFSWGDQDSTVCQAAARGLYLNISRASFSGPFPRSIAFPTPGLSFTYYTYASGNYTGSCSSWTGTVTWTSDVPTWSVTINATAAATCTNVPAGFTFSGTFHGDV